jgi:glycosyltransferase involved in cell wall biosynthesis
MQTDNTSPTDNISQQEALVSVLIPCYNAAPFILETLDSVIAQTFTNWECIVVDDHSSDNSVEIIQTCCEKYPDKIKLYINPRKGACAARNVAFEKSKGDFIQYLDADDLLAPNKIEKQMQLFYQYGSHIITSGIWGRFFNSKDDVIWESQIINKDYPSTINWLMDSWCGKGMMAQHTWLIPSHLIKIAGSWNEQLQINQDGEFFSRILIQAESIKFCREAKVYYRSGNNNSVSQSNKNKMKLNSLLLSYKLYKKNVKDYLNDISVRKALANNLLNFIYQYHAHYPTLVKETEAQFYKLDVGKMWPVGGKNFKRIAKIIGFKNALILKKILK